jgi:formylglycine-generating enzyme required for sulfatase activity
MPTLTDLPQAFGHFRVLRKLGAGGMGTVYLADDIRLGCRVALKVPHLPEDADPRLLERFLREARLGQSLHHPYVCPVYEVGQLGDIHYLTMPFIEGTPLSRLVGPELPWEPGRAAELVRRVALALEALHARGVVHRDLKPNNIMLRDNGEPVLMDFGLARALGGEQQRLTSMGRVLGTPAYMPPEQVQGDVTALGPTADVYSLGVILFELLIGRRPFDAPDLMALFYRILNDPPPRLSALRPGLDARLEAVCGKALAKRPADRHARMTELAADLDAYLRDGPAPPGPAAAGARGAATAEPVLACPKCGRRLRLPAAPGGQRFQCPYCGVPLPAPAVPYTLGSPGETVSAVLLPAREEQETTVTDAGSAGKIPGELVTVQLGGGLAMKFAWCPPGTFRMGSPPTEEKRGDDETPHRVTLTKGFYLGVHAVTQAQWKAVMGSNPSDFKGDDRPVEFVSWKDCQEFCEKLGAKTGRRFRLPTEAEWEYACRAGTTTPFHFGETIFTNQANFDGDRTYGKGKKGVFRKETTPVGSFPANAWGLYDMHGNVAEWCQDRYGPYPSEAVKDPQGDLKGGARVLRGGSWGDDPRDCRAASRNWSAPADRDVNVGCRVVLCLD